MENSKFVVIFARHKTTYLMKSFPLAAYRSYKIFGLTINPESDLCDRTWIVFDEGAKEEIVTFGKDGTVREKKGGSVTSGKWSFEEGVKRIHVELGKLDFVCVPVIFEEMLLAFEVQPGQVVFLVDQARRHAFVPKTFEQLHAYLLDYERRGIIEIDEGKRPEYKLYQSFFSTVDWGELQRRYQEETNKREARMHTPLMNGLAALIVVALAGGLVALRGLDWARYVLSLFLNATLSMQVVYLVGVVAIVLLAFAIIRMFISGSTFSSEWLEDFAGSCKNAYYESHPYLSTRQVQQISKIKIDSFEREIR